jgi:hypothetical protein
MKEKIQTWFVRSAAVLLFVAAVGVGLAIRAHTGMLAVEDPLLFLPFRKVFYIFVAVLLLVSAFLLLSENTSRRLLVIGWLADVGLVYHCGSLYYGVPVLCACFGGVGIAPRVVNVAILAGLGWLLVGSAVFLIGGWWRRRKSGG